MAGETEEQLRQMLAERDNQIRGLSQERDRYRDQAQLGQEPPIRRGAGTGYPGPGNGGGSPHVLAQALGIEGDFGPVDGYYVTRQHHEQTLQQAVDRAYAMSRGDMMVMRDIDRATSANKELGDFGSALSKKTLDILQKEGLAIQRRDGYGNAVNPQSWEDLAYNDARGLSKAVRMAQAELVLESQQAAAANQAVVEKGQAAGIASGGAPAGATPGTDQAWDDAATKGDTGAIRQLMSDHVASVTGQPAT